MLIDAAKPAAWINAGILGNYLTTLCRPAESEIDPLGEPMMPVKALDETL